MTHERRHERRIVSWEELRAGEDDAQLASREEYTTQKEQLAAELKRIIENPSEYDNWIQNAREIIDEIQSFEPDEDYETAGIPLAVEKLTADYIGGLRRLGINVSTEEITETKEPQSVEEVVELLASERAESSHANIAGLWFLGIIEKDESNQYRYSSYDEIESNIEKAIIPASDFEPNRSQYSVLRVRLLHQLDALWREENYDPTMADLVGILSEGEVSAEWNAFYEYVSNNHGNERLTDFANSLYRLSSRPRQVSLSADVEPYVDNPNTRKNAYEKLEEMLGEVDNAMYIEAARAVVEDPSTKRVTPQGIVRRYRDLKKQVEQEKPNNEVSPSDITQIAEERLCNIFLQPKTLSKIARHIYGSNDPGIIEAEAKRQGWNYEGSIEEVLGACRDDLETSRYDAKNVNETPLTDEEVKEAVRIIEGAVNNIFKNDRRAFSRKQMAKLDFKTPAFELLSAMMVEVRNDLSKKEILLKILLYPGAIITVDGVDVVDYEED